MLLLEDDVRISDLPDINDGTDLTDYYLVIDDGGACQTRRLSVADLCQFCQCPLINCNPDSLDLLSDVFISDSLTIEANSQHVLSMPNLPVYEDNAAALLAGMPLGDVYRTSTGVLMIVV